MTDKSLSLRIAARAITECGYLHGRTNRAVFLGIRDGVQKALDDGWSVLAIYNVLHDEGTVLFGYQAFRRYVNELLVGRKK